MKLAVCIQAQDTGRILFIQQAHGVGRRWTWLETGHHFNWVTSGQLDGLRSRLNRYIEISDMAIEWFHGSAGLGIVHLRVPEEREVYAPPTEPYQWVSLFDFPEDLPMHPYIAKATSDLLFLDNLVNVAV